MTRGELTHAELNENNIKTEIGYKNIKAKEDLSVADLKETVKSEFDKASKEFNSHEIQDNKELTDFAKQEIKEKTNWSDAILKFIDNLEQFKIYDDANLHEEIVNDRLCLVKNIDYNFVDPKTGKTNLELMQEGRSPIDPKTGNKITLHHMGQGFDAPFAELNEISEHGDGNHSTLHPKTEGSWRQNPELKSKYNNVDKPNHWKERAKEVTNHDIK